MSARLALLLAVAVVGAMTAPGHPAIAQARPGGLADEQASLAAFRAVAAVARSPRCINCHTSVAYPRQGDDSHPHRFNVQRGADGHGAAGLPCVTCHGKANNAVSGVPGANEDWHLAPLSMSWEGLDDAGVCRALTDPARNGGRDGRRVIEHLRTPLVRWAWAPGVDAQGRARSVPPVGYDAFLRAAETWVRTGAACPRG